MFKLLAPPDKVIGIDNPLAVKSRHEAAPLPIVTVNDELKAALELASNTTLSADVGTDAPTVAEAIDVEETVALVFVV